MVYCEKMNKQKIAEHLKELDSLVFKLRMATTALQGEIYESVTVSSESQPDPPYTGEAALTDKRNLVLPE